MFPDHVIALIAVGDPDRLATVGVRRGRAPDDARARPHTVLTGVSGLLAEIRYAWHAAARTGPQPCLQGYPTHRR